MNDYVDCFRLRIGDLYSLKYKVKGVGHTTRGSVVSVTKCILSFIVNNK